MVNTFGMRDNVGHGMPFPIPRLVTVFPDIRI